MKSSKAKPADHQEHEIQPAQQQRAGAGCAQRRQLGLHPESGHRHRQQHAIDVQQGRHPGWRQQPGMNGRLPVR